MFRNRIPAPPADLESRCLATIPVREKKEELGHATLLLDSPSRGRFRALAMLGAFAVLACVTVPALQQYLGRWMGLSQNASSSIEGPRQKVNFFRMEGWVVEWGNLRGPKSWYPDYPRVRVRSVFDSERGFSSESNFTQSSSDWVLQRGLTLASGDSYLRLDNKIWIDRRFGASRWRKDKSDVQKNFQDFSLLVCAYNKIHVAPTPIQTRVSLLARTSGDWQGYPVILLTYEERPSSNTDHHKGAALRTLLYVSPTTGRPIAMRQFVRVERREREEARDILVTEYEFWYDRRPQDARCFDVKWFSDGAQVMKRGTPVPRRGSRSAGRQE